MHQIHSEQTGRVTARIDQERLEHNKGWLRFFLVCFTLGWYKKGLLLVCTFLLPQYYCIIWPRKMRIAPLNYISQETDCVEIKWAETTFSRHDLKCRQHHYFHQQTTKPLSHRLDSFREQLRLLFFVWRCTNRIFSYKNWCNVDIPVQKLVFLEHQVFVTFDCSNWYFPNFISVLTQSLMHTKHMRTNSVKQQYLLCFYSLFTFFLSLKRLDIYYHEVLQ